MASSQSFRFDVAFTFAGAHRQKVRDIAAILSAQLGDRRVFFDEWFEYEILGSDMDTLLQRIYYEQSLMVVADLSEEYADSPWCQVEARAIRALRFDINGAEDETKRLRLIDIRFAEGHVPGALQTEGYLDGVNRTAEECAQLILNRLDLLRDRMAANFAPLKSPQRSAAQLQRGSPCPDLEERGIPFTDASFLERVENEDIELVRLFAECGFKGLNTYRRSDGRTASMIAIEKGNVAILEILIRAGADLKARDNKGRSAFDLAKDKAHEDVMIRLVHGGVTVDEPEILWWAAVRDCRQLGRILIASGVPNPIETVEASHRVDRLVSLMFGAMVAVVVTVAWVYHSWLWLRIGWLPSVLLFIVLAVISYSVGYVALTTFLDSRRRVRFFRRLRNP